MNHEEALVNAFVLAPKRERYLELLVNPKSRRKITERLNHCRDLDMTFAKLIPPNKQFLNDIEKMLREKGAPTVCFVLSSNPDIDNKEMALRDALRETIGMGLGTLISCIPGKLGYFEDEEANERYILERP